MNEYDQTKRMLNTLRDLDRTKMNNLKEQVSNYDQSNVITNNNPQQQSSEESTDVDVINNVDVKINSSDQSDLELKDDEKNKISQLIDDFKNEVSELVDFDKLDIYGTSGKLSGKLNNLGIEFVLSAGDDDGLYLNNTSLLKIDDNSMDIIGKLKIYQQKFSSVINEIIATRKDN